MAKIKLINGVYVFDAGDGSVAVECKVWLEKSKASDKHPDGKPWIKLPKDNITNRTYYSEDLFLKEQVDGEVTVEIKTTAPRVLGATGVKQSVIKHLSEEDAAEYTALVEPAVAAFKEAKSKGKLKPEDMNADQLAEYIEALKAGKKYTPAEGPKSFLDMFNEEQYDRYNELLAKSAENKANKPRAKRGPLTPEQKAERAAKRTQKEISKAQELLAAMRATME